MKQQVTYFNQYSTYRPNPWSPVSDFSLVSMHLCRTVATRVDSSKRRHSNVSCDKHVTGLMGLFELFPALRLVVADGDWGSRARAGAGTWFLRKTIPPT